MRPVDQTTFGASVGNCMSACIASLLDLPIKDVPNFLVHGDMMRAMSSWLRPRGLDPVLFEPKGLWNGPADVPCIHVGATARGEVHAVVGRGLRPVHDPHPSRAGLTSLNYIIVLVCHSPEGLREKRATSQSAGRF